MKLPQLRTVAPVMPQAAWLYCKFIDRCANSCGYKNFVTEKIEYICFSHSHVIQRTDSGSWKCVH